MTIRFIVANLRLLTEVMQRAGHIT
jgi:hypothetical protein